MLKKLKNLLTKAHENGIMIPLARDPKYDVPSISLTLMLISFGLSVLGIIGKWSKYLDVDVDQAIYLFGITSALYFGRQLGGSGKVVLGEDLITNKKENESNVK